MRVCHLTSVHKCDDIRIFFKECVSLANHDYDVFLVVANSESRKMNGVQIVNATSKNRSRLSRILFTTREVYQTALELKADIYHIHDPELLPFALKLKRKGKKVIYDAHEDLPKQVLDKHWIPLFMRKLISKFVSKYEAYVAKRIDAIVSVNSPIVKRFEKHNSNVFLIANYPLDDEIRAFQTVQPKKIETQICYVGGLSPTRGTKQLIESLEHLDVSLVIAGNFSTVEFEQEVKQLSNWKKVLHKGYVGRSELLEILNSSAIGMLTLLPTASYVESWPIKLFEYMASGIPVIASKFSLWEELIEKNGCGICVNPYDPKSIGNAVRRLIEDKETAKLMGENGRRMVVEEFNWTSQEKILLKLYNLLDQKETFA